jgi:hypothetical protein
VIKVVHIYNLVGKVCRDVQAPGPRWRVPSLLLLVDKSPEMVP